MADQNVLLNRKLTKCGHLEVKTFLLVSLILSLYNISPIVKMTLIMFESAVFVFFCDLCVSPSCKHFYDVLVFREIAFLAPRCRRANFYLNTILLNCVSLLFRRFLGN